MVKKKQFLTPKKESKKRKPAEPETANDFLEVGVDREEAGEKWRAGDAAKSMRFFLRAIETYDEGLQKFPEDFDLAYNKARLQYEVTEQPRLLVHTSTPLQELLQAALDSHRYALTIDQDNADLLFNIAQVLTSLAETITEGKTPSEESRDQGIKLLQESLEFWQRCLTVQEYQLNQAEEGNDESSQQQQQTTSASESPEEEETYATVSSPPTPSTLLDTLLAQLETLTQLATLSPSSSQTTLPWIQEYHTTTLLPKLTHLSHLTSRNAEIHLSVAKFQTTLAESSYRTNLIDLPTYERELHESFVNITTATTTDPRTLCDKADAELAFALCVRLNANGDATTEEEQSHDETLYQHASLALENYTAATRLPPPAREGQNSWNLAAIHLRRGDCEVLRWSIGSSNATSTDKAEESETKDAAEPKGEEEDDAMDLDSAPETQHPLLAAAALNYRMAGRAATSVSASHTVNSSGTLSLNIGGAEEAKEEGKEAYVKGLIVEMLAGDGGKAGGGWSKETWRDVREVVGGLGEEGVLRRGEVERVLGSG